MLEVQVLLTCYWVFLDEFWIWSRVTVFFILKAVEWFLKDEKRNIWEGLTVEFESVSFISRTSFIKNELLFTFSNLININNCLKKKYFLIKFLKRQQECGQKVVNGIFKHKIFNIQRNYSMKKGLDSKNSLVSS